MRLMRKGGLETRLFNYMNWFLERGHEVTLFVSKVDPLIILPPGVRLLHIDLSVWPRPVRHLIFNYKLEPIMRREAFDYTLSLERTWVQDHLIAPNTHVGYIQAQHKIWRSPSDLIQLYLDKRSFRAAKHIYACSQMVKDEIVNEYKIAAEKIQVVYPPLNTQRFNRDLSDKRQTLRDFFHMNDGRKHFVFASTSHKRKGLELLLALFALPEHQNKVLHVPGSNFVSTLPNVRSLGFCDNMADLYTAADGTLHPAQYEPFGQVVSESLACGAPVLISSNTGAKEIVDAKSGIVVDGFDLKKWSESLEKLATETFEIPFDFAERKGLSLDQHMKKIFPYS